MCSLMCSFSRVALRHGAVAVWRAATHCVQGRLRCYWFAGYVQRPSYGQDVYGGKRPPDSTGLDLKPVYQHSSSEVGLSKLPTLHKQKHGTCNKLIRPATSFRCKGNPAIKVRLVPEPPQKLLRTSRQAHTRLHWNRRMCPQADEQVVVQVTANM